MIINTDNLKTEKKKLKRHHVEQKRLEMILTHIKQCRDYNELKNSPVSKMFHFEELKHGMNGYCSFNLCKGRGGVIRLICVFDRSSQTIKIEFISMRHYDDFKKVVLK